MPPRTHADYLASLTPTLRRATASYRGPKGNLKLPYAAPPSAALLLRIAKALHARATGAAKKRARVRRSP